MGIHPLLAVFAAAALSLQGYAAVVVTEGSRLSWDFTLVGGRPGTDSIDQFVVQYGPDLLHVGEMVLITVYAMDPAAPVYTHTRNGFGNGLSGLLWTGNWDTAFPTHDGTVVIEVLQGEVDVKRITIQLSSLAFSGSASISPAVHLVPEPASSALFLAGSMLLMRRRRRSRHL